jgi:hypothetical protein
VRAKWERVPVRTASGPVAAIAPVIISASRATDLPAFHGEWFADRLVAGHCTWCNPFNARQRQLVSFARTRVVVFWSKNPAPLERHLGLLDERGINYLFTFTVNDYEREGLEPGVPPLAERLATFRRLSERLGSERVVWRFDPIVLGGALTPARILEKIERIGEALYRHTRTLVVSFADITRYPHVAARLKRSGKAHFGEPAPDAVLAIAAGLARLKSSWGLEIATCAEQVDLSAHGIAHSRCIDDRLMARAFSHDAALMAFLARGAAPPLAAAPAAANPLKDAGQRAACGCIVSKDIGWYDSCHHRCAYCYANTTLRQVDDGRRQQPRGRER